MTNLRFTPEWEVLEQLCVGLDSEDSKSKVLKVVSTETFDWGELLEQAIVHKLFSLLSFHVVNTFSSDIPVHKLIFQTFENQLELNLYKTKIFRSEASKLVEILSNEGILFAATKGIAYESSIYNSNGSRNFETDIDFMIDPDARTKVTSVLKKNGYQVGEYDRSSNSVVPHPREEELKFKLYPDHLLPYTVVTNDPLCKYLNIDIAFSFTWFNSEYVLPVCDALVDRKFQNIPGEKNQLPVLSDEYALIFTALHLFREAWFYEKWVKIGQDVNLMKFSDIINLSKAIYPGFDHAKFQQIIENCGLSKPLYWVFEHLDRTFGQSFVKDYNIQKVNDENYLNSAFTANQQLLYWTGSMRERLFIKDKRSLFR